MRGAWLGGGVLLAVGALMVGVTGPGMVGSAAAEPSRLDYAALAGRIVQQMAIRPGEKVLLVAYPGLFSELVGPLRLAVMRAGGVDLGCWVVLPLPPPAGSGVDGPALMKALEASRGALRERLRDVDAAIMLPGATLADPEYAAMQDVLREGRGRTVHFHWDGFDAPSAMAVPGHAVPAAPVIDALYQQAVLQSDCQAIGRVQRRFAAELRQAEVHVTTPAGTDLRWRSGDRPANLQDGDASAARARLAQVQVDREIEIPCGVLRVAPIEATVEGVIVFPPAKWNDHDAGAVRLRFVHGRVTEVTAVADVAPGFGTGTATGTGTGTGTGAGAGAAAGSTVPATQAAVEAELAAGGDAARWFREFALGFNPLLAVPAAHPFIPYYGYGAGVVRLSLGDNSEIGGSVRGDYARWNFFADATVTVGGKTWVRDGKLLLPATP